MATTTPVRVAGHQATAARRPELSLTPRLVSLHARANVRGNTARIKRDHVEAVLLAEIDAEILSDEAIACAQKAIQAELRRVAKRDKAEPLAITPKLAKPDA